ncbi:MAG: hypothetical protein R3B84_07645 [Zavarzinella sp.]
MKLITLHRFVPLLFTILYLAAPITGFAQKQFGFDNRKPSGQEYLTPEQTISRMKVAEEFEVKLFAGEPDLSNPIAFTIDERGRVWAIESFEYPSRTPKGKAPRDRIVILEDTNGDGKCDKRTVFAEGKIFLSCPNVPKTSGEPSTWQVVSKWAMVESILVHRLIYGTLKIIMTNQANLKCCSVDLEAKIPTRL